MHRLMLSTVTRSVYPKSKNPFVKRNDLNVTISPLVKTENTASKLWSHIVDTDLEDDSQPNQFFLLIPEWLICVKPKEIQPIGRKCDITNVFAKIPSSKTKEKKTEVTQVPLPKSIKKEEKVKKRGAKKDQRKEEYRGRS